MILFRAKQRILSLVTKNQCFSKIFFCGEIKTFLYQSLTKKLNSCPNFRIKDKRREAHFNSYFSSACFFGNIIRRWCAQSTPVPPTIKHEYYLQLTSTLLHTALAHSHIDDFCIFLRRLCIGLLVFLYLGQSTGHGPGFRDKEIKEEECVRSDVRTSFLPPLRVPYL